MIPEHPFAPLHSRESFLETPSIQEALGRLMDGLGTREPFLLLTGDPGTGKTALVTEALARWGSRITAAFLAYPALAGVELLEEIVRRLGHEPPEGANRPRLVASLERVLAEIAGRGQVAVVVVDDAHDLSAESLEELRLLVNTAQMARLPLEVLLVGLPSLETRLAEPALVALQQRISVRARVMSFSVADTQRYLHHRVNAAGGDGPSLFSRRTCRDIATLTGGVARRINALASESLRLARAADQPTVTPEHVQAAASALWGAASTAGPLAMDEPDPSDPPPAAPPPASGPQASAPTVAPAAAPVDDSGFAEADTPRPVLPATHDAQEWVARFIGDKGPLQLSSLAVGPPERAPQPSEPIEAESPKTGATSSGAPRRRPGAMRAPSRSKRRRDRGVPILASLVALVVLGAVALIIRSGGLARGGRGQAAKVTAIAATPRDATMPQSARPARGGGASPGGQVAAPQPGVRANAARRYTIDVGGYLDFQRALEERDRMQSLTGIEAWVVVGDESEGRTHRIVVGIFRSPDRATSAAEAMLANRTLSEARVIPLPPQRVRR